MLLFFQDFFCQFGASLELLLMMRHTATKALKAHLLRDSRLLVLVDVWRRHEQNMLFFLKLALVGVIPNQVLFSFSSDKDRRTDSRIRQKTQLKEKRI